jgi:hypothetical protein|uniref:Uncharacterized protein n=1 Tax=Siphoviridae sp. ctFiA6 TaxID=2823573 RepID=A0A8S5LGG9_9CAUD|nr:MAG TPA: hypothetical protein [Siphoviridae sp. ctFiA6]DAY01753.1 MAG TPA: hypothetical protein [Caudoviricetes sp.]
MVLLSDVRDFIASLNFVDDEHVYSGKLEDKKDKSIGIYNRKVNTPDTISLGGLKLKSFGIKQISILVHWNKSQRETEKATIKLFNLLQNQRNFSIGQTKGKFILMGMNEPQSVDTDDNGIYEYVIWCDIYCEREE